MRSFKDNLKAMTRGIEAMTRGIEAMTRAGGMEGNWGQGMGAIASIASHYIMQTVSHHYRLVLNSKPLHKVLNSQVGIDEHPEK